MSRSRRAPVWTDGYKSKWRPKAKRRANRRVRLYGVPNNGMAYKRLSCSWDICDFKFYDIKNPKASRK